MAFLDNNGVVNLVTDIQEKIKASFATKSHEHSAADVVGGVFSIWQIPTGTTTDTVAKGNHGHGSITNSGAITSDTAVASGDKLVISDSSDSSKLKRSGIAFGSSTSTFLRNDGTWVNPLSYTERAAYYSTSITNGTSAYSSASTTGWTILDFGSTYVAFGFVSASVSCSTAFGPYYIQSADRYLRLPYATANIIACIFGTAFGGASNSGVSAVLRGNNANYLPSSGSLYGLPFRFTSPTSFSTAATQKVPVMVVGRKSS